MKTRIIITTAIIGTGLLAGVLIHSRQSSPDQNAASDPVTDDSQIQRTPPIQPEELQARRDERPAPSTESAPASSALAKESTESPIARSTSNLPSPLFSQAVECLASGQTTFEQRREAIVQLRQSGKLDAAIVELEKRMSDDPQSAQNPATLGQLYLQKCSVIEDIREQAILAMKADQAFDAALNLDPNNWEARFTKAVALSYWPAETKTSDAMIGHFVTLMEQQEKQASQPHFAQTYQRLGDQYQKLGRPDYAKDVWQRGAALFPQDKELQQRLQP